MAHLVNERGSSIGTSRLASFVADLAAIVLFVAIGRSAHKHGVNSSGMVRTAWPFVVGLCIGWIVIIVRRLADKTWRSGAIIVVFTVTIGMLLRVIAGQGTAVAFIGVAIAFLGTAMIGWRTVLRFTNTRES